MNQTESKIVPRHCKECVKETSHYQLDIDTPTPQTQTKKEQTTEFISAFVAGWGAGPTAAFMELRDRHFICEVCGSKIVEKYRNVND